MSFRYQLGLIGPLYHLKFVFLLIPITLDRLIGSGNWGETQDQVLLEHQAIEQVR